MSNCKKSIKIILLLLMLLAYSLPVLASEEFKGNVTSLFVTQYRTGTDAYYYGSLVYVARLGGITRPAVKNSENKTVKRGTLLYSLNQNYWKKQMIGSRDLMVYAKKTFEETVINFKRYKYLVVPGAVSWLDFENYLSTMSTAYTNYLNDKASFIENQEFLKISYQVASFEGIVDKVLYNQGLTDSNIAPLEVTMLNPIGIHVKIPRDKARLIGTDTPVKIYPLYSDKPQGIYYGYSMLNPDGITFVTFNKPSLPPDARGHKILRNTFAVTDFYINTKDSTLSVPFFSLGSDLEGEYIFKLEKFDDTKESSLHKVRKMYVKCSGKSRLLNGNVDLQELSDSGTLKSGDLISDDSAAILADGEVVCIPPPLYTFMPGDEVRVVIGRK
ncbi:MAG TPA: hypothetical protein DD381_07670 [Lentisphaeria bacterium]|nr:MAG: hypothetical protein A2X47_04235 [Lentisphaerae bacterium GWF2_38_69]HBM16199.1 hypothetical protein [Lentisphaeria bacterium]